MSSLPILAFRLCLDNCSMRYAISCLYAVVTQNEQIQTKFEC